MAATCNEDDPASVERFLRAMQPMDVHRSSVRSNADDHIVEARPATPATPVAPTPVVSPVVSPSPFLDVQ